MRTVWGCNKWRKPDSSDSQALLRKEEREWWAEKKTPAAELQIQVQSKYMQEGRSPHACTASVQVKGLPEICWGIPLLPPLKNTADPQFIRWMKWRTASREQDADRRDGLLEIGKGLFAVDCDADGSLCWNVFDYLTMFARILHAQSTEAANSLLVNACISCCHYHPVEFISVNVIYSARI